MQDERLTMGGDCGRCGAEDIEVDSDGLCEKCYNEIATAQRGQGQESEFEQGAVSWQE